MARAYTSTVLAAPSAKVWELLGDFGGWHRWSPRIASSTLESGDTTTVGAVRLLDLARGGEVRERLVAYDAVRRTLSYDSPGEVPFPVRSYLGTVTVYPVETDGTAFVEWYSEFDADADVEAKLAQTFVKIYNGFLEDLRKAL